jgi:enamine deaminase RidA (YjgF/YER057c/UK114 family)
MVEDKLRELGYSLPEVSRPVAAYVPGVLVDGMVYTSGQLPLVNGKVTYPGRLGEDLSVSQGYEAARLCALNCLAVVKQLVGSLNRVEKIVKVVGYVNCAPGFNEQPKVINGASELLGQVFGEIGQHARSAVGVSALPLEASVELEMVVKVK